jgi:protein-disulfide isomerase
MDWKKNSWMLSFVGLIVLASAVANIDRILGLSFAGSRSLNFTNNPNGIVVEEFSDFACPFCNQARAEVYSVLERYNGKVNFMFRHLIVHAETELAAQASECARDQQKFFEFADLVYDNQGFALQDLNRYAETAGLNMTLFAECVESGRKAEVLQRDYDDAFRRNVMGTPAFFVDGEQVPVEYLGLAIEEAYVRSQP